MSGFSKFLIGLACALIAGWLWHGPLGQGDAFLDSLERQAQAVVTGAEVAGVEAHFRRDPMSRVVTLSGPADPFQREGQGLFPGLNDRIGAIEGISGIRWQDDPASGSRIMPMILETLCFALITFLIGLGLGRLIFRPRRKREGYLDD